MKVQISIKSVYGNTLYYPANDVALIFARRSEEHTSELQFTSLSRMPSSA